MKLLRSFAPAPPEEAPPASPCGAGAPAVWVIHWGMPSADASLALQLELLGRLLLAAVLGGLIGLEREMARHAAGLRTHILVTLGAAAFTVAGTYGVQGLGTNQDPGRVAAQIVTGIGFLGAGTIWRYRQSDGQGSIRGLTTAATIWVAAAIGMLTGFGLYYLAAGSAVIGLVVLRVLKVFDPMVAGREGIRSRTRIPGPPPPSRRRPAGPKARPPRPPQGVQPRSRTGRRRPPPPAGRARGRKIPIGTRHESDS
jgi:putative Mg2+ transporter-C (MgtC) family protein